ncbi:MAG: DNA repair protein RecO [Planctomycetota bacterium]|jgi:DNA repair protein RecO (recombination protein O)
MMSNPLQRLVTLMQTRVTDQPAYLLHRRDWQNSSLILDLFTLDHGRLSVLARGGKVSKSSALFQPFCHLLISWSGRHELKTLVSIEASSAPIDEKQYLPLLYINELLTAFLPRQEANPELFDLYRELLGEAGCDFGQAQLREFEREMMRILGYLPDTSRDAESGKSIMSNQFYQFIASNGFVPCEEKDRNAIGGHTVIAWNQKQYENKQVLQLAKTIMRCIIDFNLHGKKLKSRDIYQQIKSLI